jgi:DNA-binding response OmpR family regulator
MLYPKQWILIIEDEQDLIDMLSEELSRIGFSVLSCSRAADAIRIVRNQKFECILLDMRLEGGTGSQIIFSVRDDKKNLNYGTPVIVVSGQLSVDLVLKIKDSVSGVFVKPFDLASLINKVKALCPISEEF